MNGYFIPATLRLIRRKITVSVSSSSNRSIQQHRQATLDPENNRTHESSDRADGALAECVLRDDPSSCGLSWFLPAVYDFCYLANILLLVHIWFFPHSAFLHKVGDLVWLLCMKGSHCLFRCTNRKHCANHTETLLLATFSTIPVNPKP